MLLELLELPRGTTTCPFGTCIPVGGLGGAPVALALVRSDVAAAVAVTGVSGAEPRAAEAELCAAVYVATKDARSTMGAVDIDCSAEREPNAASEGR